MDAGLIYDVGLYHGEDTAYYLHKGFRVVAIEADSALIELARERFAYEIRTGRLTLLNVAIAAHRGTASFWVCPNARYLNSLSKTWTESVAVEEAQPVAVQTERFGAILQSYGVPYYLKVDIQGSDGLCVADLAPPDLPRYISVEIAEFDTLVRLNQLGYNRFKCIDQSSGQALPFPPRAAGLKRRLKTLAQPYPVVRRLFHNAHAAASTVTAALRLSQPTQHRHASNGSNWAFSPDSSGPFGEDTLGPWLSAEQIASVWLAEWRQCGCSAPEMWVDLHASLS